MSKAWTCRALRTAGAAVFVSGLLAPVALGGIRFEARSDAPTTHRQPAAAVAADFYGADGVLDIAVTYYGSGRLVFYQNNGTGGFTERDVLSAASPDVGEDSTIGAGPRGLIAIDLDADTVPDVAGCNEQASHFFAYFNRTSLGTGWVRSAPLARRGNAGIAVTSAHWNPALDSGGNPIPGGDWAEELIFAFGNGSVGISRAVADVALLPTGDFLQMARFTHRDVSGLTDVDVADFDPATTTLDVLTTDHDSQQLVIWRGDPVLPGSIEVDTGTNLPVITRIATTVSSVPVKPVQAITSDWNGDTLEDALVLMEEGYVLFYAGTGTASIFQSPSVTDLIGGLSPARLPSSGSSMELVDLDGDTVRDLMVTNSGDAANSTGFNWLSVYHGCSENPEPVFDLSGLTCGQAPQHHAVGDLAPQRPGSILVEDFDGDTFRDIVVLTGDARSRWMSFLRNRGDGTFVAGRSFAAGGRGPVGLDAADLDGDGRADAAVALAPDIGVPADHGAAILKGNADGTLGVGVRLPPSGLIGPQTLVLASVDGDTDLDVLCDHPGGGNDTRAWPGNGNATFGTAIAGGGIAGVVRTGDLAGSVALDLAAMNGASAELKLWTGRGDGTFTLGLAFPRIFGYADHVTAHFLGHQKDDVVISALTSDQFDAGATLFVVPYDDAAGRHGPMTQLTLPPQYSGAFSTPFTRLVAGDFDGNTHPDLIAITAQGEVVVFRSDGSQLTYDASVSTAVVDPGVSSALARDLDLDGSLDLVAAASDRVNVLSGTGGGGFSSSLALPSNLTNSTIAAADIDGDGLEDLLVTSTRTSDVTVFRNLSAATFVLRVRHDRIASQTTAWWGDQGPGATYDLVRGDLRNLLVVDRDTSGASCVVGGDNFTTPSWLDTDPVPARVVPELWSSWYYLVRCAGGDCREPTFGTDSFGAPHVLPLACP